MNQCHLGPLVRLCALALGLFGAACGDGEGGENDGPPAEPGEVEIEVAGTWDASAMGMSFGTETISSEEWSGALVAEFDNDENYAITRNADDATFGPGLYNRNVWTEPTGGSFYYCTVAFSLESVEAARESNATADDSDPETGGCGGTFPWTKLSQ